MIGRVSRAHCEAFLFRTFAAFVAGGGAPPHVLDSRGLEAAALGRLLALHGLSTMEATLDEWLEDGYLAPHQAAWVRAAAAGAMNSVTDDAVALVDAWGFADRELQSPLGRWDGQVYPAVFEAAQASTLNTQLDPEAYRFLLRPLNSTVDIPSKL